MDFQAAVVIHFFCLNFFDGEGGWWKGSKGQRILR